MTERPNSAGLPPQSGELVRVVVELFPITHKPDKKPEDAKTVADTARITKPRRRGIIRFFG